VIETLPHRVVRGIAANRRALLNIVDQTRHLLGLLPASASGIVCILPVVAIRIP
jgi:hypothetical protein